MNSFSSSHPRRGDNILCQLLRIWERLGERSRSGNSGVCAADVTDTATAVLMKRRPKSGTRGTTGTVDPVPGSTQILELFILYCLSSKLCTLLEKAGFVFTEINFPRRSFSSAQLLRKPQCSYGKKPHSRCAIEDS